MCYAADKLTVTVRGISNALKKGGSKDPRPEDVALGNPLEGGEKPNLRAVANMILVHLALA